MSTYKSITTKSFDPIFNKDINEKNEKIGSKRKNRNNDSKIILNDVSRDIVQNDVWNSYHFTGNEKKMLNETLNKLSGTIKSKENDRPQKRRKIDNSIDKDDKTLWVSATKTKYYLLDDQCIDWLNTYYDRYGIESESLSDEQKQQSKQLLKDASHVEILFEGGNIFEQKIYDELKGLHDKNFVVVFNENDMKIFREQKDMSMIRKGNNTVKELMLAGIPIIAQAPLINDDNMTYGIADILIRSDYLNIVFKTFVPDDDINIHVPFLNKNYHYRVIDCKWTTMTLCVDGVTIRNDDLFPAYKGQLAVYTACLESLQGYIPNYAYILAKAWKIDKTNITEQEKNNYRGYSAFDRPGIINYSTRDNHYLEKTKEAIIWMRRVITEGNDWRYHSDKPSVVEMYPNMNKNFNPVFDKIKEMLAIRYGDPTMVWHIGSEHRDHAFLKKIYSIYDPACTASSLGVKSSERKRVIDNILEINRQKDDIVRPLCIKNNMLDWQNEQPLEYFIDFETINYNLFVNPYDMDIDNSYFDSDVTFMIGIGFEHDPNIDSNVLIESLGIDKLRYNYHYNADKKNDWEYISLYLVEFKIQNELEIFRLFFQFILARNELLKHKYNLNTYPDDISRLFHWTGAEIRFINKAINRIRSGYYTENHMHNTALNFTNPHLLNENNNDDKNTLVEDTHLYLNNLIDSFKKYTVWLDMHKVFETEPIVTKNAYRFKLKHIGNAFNRHGLIDTTWDDGIMSDGFRAMLEAIRLYRGNSLFGSTEGKLCSTDSGSQTTNGDLCLNGKYKDIINYNETDCRVIWEIVCYLRDNHCNA